MKSTQKNDNNLHFASIMAHLAQNPSDCLLIVPNLRTAQWMQHHFTQAQQAKGITQWYKPAVMALSSWQEQLALTCIHHPREILSPDQERHLWQQMVQRVWPNYHDTPLPIVQRGQLASLAQSAWERLQDACLDLDALSGHLQEDIAFFKHCAKLFKRTCLRHQWMSMSERNRELAAHVSDCLPHIPATVYLYGFDHISRSTRNLLDVLEEHRIVHWLQPPPMQARTVQVSAQNLHEEWIMMMQWAKDTATQNPGQQVLCLVPGLHQHRPALQRLAADIFTHATHQEASISYNISSGRPCAEHRMIRHALMLLRLAEQRSLPIEELSELIRSQHVAGAYDEISQRALLDVALRERYPAQITLKQLAYHAHQHTCPKLVTCCQILRSTEQTIPPAPTPWHTHFHALLSACGWPGEQRLDSESHQLHKAWHDCLTQLATLTTIQHNMSGQAARRALQSIAQHKLFQKEAPVAPIEIVGILEGSTLLCDHLWVSGLTDQQWPAKAAPHPFLPIQLQHQYDMPHATAEKELVFSQSLFARLQHHAGTLIASYACLDDRDQACLPSPMIRAFKNANHAMEAYRALLFKEVPLERYTDDQAQPVSDATRLAHGTRLFQHQANCPFQAFAIHRLHATEMPKAEAHCTAMDKGIIIHRALDMFWRQTRDQATLLAMETSAYDALLTACVKHAMQDVLGRKQIAHTCRAAIQTSIKATIDTWLNLEKQRPPFRIAAIEQDHAGHWFGIPIHLRPDRVDQLDNGQYVMIDYKTGQASMHDWFKEPLVNTQMPLYALAWPVTVDGIAYAHVKLFECRWQGVLDKSQQATDAFPTLHTFEKVKHGEVKDAKKAVWAQWREGLEQLAESFLQGIAKVSPQSEQTCQHCHLMGLCRIHDLQDGG